MSLQRSCSRALASPTRYSRLTLCTSSSRRLGQKFISTVGAHEIPSATTPSSHQEEFDLVIVGGGPAGLALAGALASSPVAQSTLKIALIEAGDLECTKAWTQPPGTFSNRVSSITNMSKAFLEDIGAWHYIEESRTRPVEDMQVWDGISDARISFSATEVLSNSGNENINDIPLQLAQMTENLNIQRALLRLLADHPQVRVMDKIRVEGIERDEQRLGGWPIIKTSDGRSLRARLLVGADGFNSPVKKFAGIDTYGWAYDTHAIVATLFHAPVYPNAPITAYQRFLPTGPIAFLPLSSTASSLVWSTKPQIASALKSLDPDILRRMINAAFRLPELSVRYLHDLILQSTSPSAGTSTLTPAQVAEDIKWREESHGILPHSALSSSYGEMGGGGGVGGYGGEVDLPALVTSIQPGSIASFPLKMSHADVYLGEGQGSRTALVGDAAHTVHPLAGQGLNMGLGDVQCLVKCIEEAITNGADIGSFTALASYPRERYFENHKVISATDKLHKLYSTTNPAVVWARSVGLEVVNELDTFKSALMMSAGSSADRSVGAGLPLPSLDAARDTLSGGMEAVNRVVQTGGAAACDLGNRGSNVLRSMVQSLRM